MAANRQPLCLNMIVKNEAPVIARCLASLRPIIDYWVIVDTGSTDGTQDKIRTLMADLPGELHERPWRDFAHNRTEALELARPHGEYVLIIDADDVLEFEPQFKMPALQKDSYMLRIADTSIAYNRTQTTNPFVALRAGVAVSQVFFDFHAPDEVELAVDIAVNQLTRFVATQCVPPFPCVWRAALAVVCARAPIAT